MTGRCPRWSFACEGCERCINQCPRKAIQTSVVRIAVMIAAFGAVDKLGPHFHEALRPLPGFASSVLWVPLSAALGLALFRLADLALVGLAFVPGIRPILAFGWTRWFRRYRGPQANKDRAIERKVTEVARIK